MKIISWNIQSTQGCDAKFDFQRICDTLNAQGNADVICLQEVSRNFEEYGANDQLALFQKAFPDFEAVWAPALSLRSQNKCRREFGNLTLVRSPLLLNAHLHSLPNPPAQGLMQMPRSLVETRIAYQDKTLSLFNTHLAYHHQAERMAQVQYICQLKAQGMERQRAPSQAEGSGAYHPLQEADDFLLCGDLNLTQYTQEYEYLISTAQWVDCWTALYPNIKHPATCGIFDHIQWKEGENCRDFFMITPSLQENLISMQVDQKTNASDHQPIILDLRKE